MPNWSIDDVLKYSKRKELPTKLLVKSGYNPAVVVAFFKEHGLPEPKLELKFHPDRKWRFDFAWVIITNDETIQLALEVQGGIWSAGRHNRGSSMLKEWEKLNEAAALGWRILYCQPDDLCTLATVTLIKRCLNQKEPA